MSVRCVSVCASVTLRQSRLGGLGSTLEMGGFEGTLEMKGFKGTLEMGSFGDTARMGGFGTLTITLRICRLQPS